MSRPFPTGDPAGGLLWTADQGLCGGGIQAEGPPAADDIPGPDQDYGWVGSSDALRCQGGRRKPEGRRAALLPWSMLEVIRSF